MGHPKQQKKKYARPLKAFSKERLIDERKLMDKYGLKRKKELWRAQEFIRDVRGRAMKLLASENPKMRKEMMEKLYALGLVSKDAAIDDVLGLGVDKYLERRLQTIIHTKGLANSIKHARQMIVHGRVEVDGRRVQQPTFIITRVLEDNIKLAETSAKKKEKVAEPSTIEAIKAEEKKE